MSKQQSDAGKLGGQAFAEKLTPRKRKTIGQALLAARLAKDTPERREQRAKKIAAGWARRKIGLDQVVSVHELMPPSAIAAAHCAKSGKWGIYLVCRGPWASVEDFVQLAPCLAPGVIDGSLPAPSLDTEDYVLLALFSSEDAARVALGLIDPGGRVVAQLIGADGKFKS